MRLLEFFRVLHSTRNNYNWETTGIIRAQTIPQHQICPLFAVDKRVNGRVFLGLPRNWRSLIINAADNEIFDEKSEKMRKLLIKTLTPTETK